MSILTRMTRLFKADIHSILDNLEQPEIILQQSVRDMQSAIDAAEISLSELDKQQAGLEQKQQNMNSQITDLQEQLQFCLREKNDTLGKSVIKKKLQAGLILKELSTQLANIIIAKKLKNNETDERKEKLQAVRDKLALFTEHAEFSEHSVATELSSNISQDDIELAFLYEKQSYAEVAEGEKT